MGYACKGCRGTSDWVSIFKNLAKSSDENSSVKSLTAKLMLKTVGMIDTPAAAADFINTGNKLVESSRRFRRIGLSGYRPLNDKKGSDTATKKTALDKFCEMDSKERTGLCLYDYAMECDCAKKNACGQYHVPVFTGVPTQPMWPPSENYAKGQLMMFSKSIWRTTEQLLAEHDTYASAFAVFLETSDCPDAVRFLMKNAKLRYDLKKNKRTQERQSAKDKGFESSQHSQFSCSQNSDYTDSQTSSLPENSLGYQLLRDIDRKNSSYTHQPEVDEYPLPDVGHNFDWNAHGLESLGFDLPMNIIEVKNWLIEASASIENGEIERRRQFDLPQVNPLLVNEKQMTATHIILKRIYDLFTSEHHYKCNKADPLKMIVQGCAGTGKSQIVKIVCREVRRMLKANNAVINVAPTSAAAILLPNGRTIHSFTPPPFGKKAKSVVSLNERPMTSDKLDRLKKILYDTNKKLLTCFLNCDERGMVGQPLLAWHSQRLVEATLQPEDVLAQAMHQTFGNIPVVNLFGDVLQLGAVKQTDLHHPPTDDNAIKNAGYTIYSTIKNVIVLDEIMRQKPAQQALRSRLNNIRCGKIT